MIDVRGLANAATTTVNPNVVVSVLKSTGYTAGAGARQVPSYATAIIGPVQIQALDGDDLKQLDGLNIQGTIRALYGNGFMAGVLRPNQEGGDIVKITDMSGFPGARDWLVVKVLEGWPTWTKVAIVLQGE